MMMISVLMPLSTYQTNAEDLYQFLIEYKMYAAETHDPNNEGEFKIEFWLLIDTNEYKVYSETYTGTGIGDFIPGSHQYASVYSAYIDSNDEYCTNVFETDPWPNPDDRVIPNPNIETSRYCFRPYSLFTDSTRTEGNFVYIEFREDPAHEDLHCWLEIRVTILDIVRSSGGGSPVPIE